MPWHGTPWHPTLHLKAPKEPLFVAAAGNAGHVELAYPARFANVIAVGAVTSNYVLSSESNFGDRDHLDSPHQNHYVLPGGEPNPPNDESVGEFASHPGPWHGTSMATAYASGAIACLLAGLRPGGGGASMLLPILRGTADAGRFAPSDAHKHGHGVLQV